MLLFLFFVRPFRRYFWVTHLRFNAILNVTENGHLLYFVEFPSVLFNYLAGYEVCPREQRHLYAPLYIFTRVAK